MNKVEFHSDELAGFLDLKFREGIYPHLRKLQDQHLIAKKGKGIYALDTSSESVKTIKFLLDLFGKDTAMLLGIHTKRILERFSRTPILKASELPGHNLRKVRALVEKTRVIHQTKEGGIDIYFIRSWEEPTKKLLRFFGIVIAFDEEEYKHRIVKQYSAFTGKQTHLKDERQEELIKSNMRYYVEMRDLILPKLRGIDLAELGILGIVTSQKISKMSNPFELTRKIQDWKIKYIYNTDRIEGNALTFEEVRTVLTIGSEGVKREKKDVLETVNSRIAIDNVFDTTNELDVDFIKKLHLCTQQGIDPDAGAYKSEENCIVDNAGNLLDMTTPARFVDERMHQLISWYDTNKNKFHPICLASVVHNQFVFIHPFSDGNGRVARLLFNFILIKHGFFPIIFYNDEKQRYYSALRGTKEGDMAIFIRFCSDLYRSQLDAF